MTAPPREPVFCPQRKKPCIAGCPYPSECPDPAPSAELAEAERDALHQAELTEIYKAAVMAYFGQ